MPRSERWQRWLVANQITGAKLLTLDYEDLTVATLGQYGIDEQDIAALCERLDRLKPILWLVLFGKTKI